MSLLADDTVLLAKPTAIIRNLKAYCGKWNISVDIDKSKVVVFKSGNRTNCRLFFDNTEFENVSSFTYLGVSLTSNGNFFKLKNN